MCYTESVEGEIRIKHTYEKPPPMRKSRVRVMSFLKDHTPNEYSQVILFLRKSIAGMEKYL